MKASGDFSKRLSSDRLLPPFSFLLALRHTHISIGKRHTDRFGKPANTTPTLCKVLLSPLALADAEAAASYQLTTRFVLGLSLRYSLHPRIAVEQPYCRTGVHNTFADANEEWM